MNDFIQKVEEDFTFLQLQEKDKNVSGNPRKGHCAIMYLLNKSNFNLVFYQNFNKYQVQIFPKLVDKKVHSIDAPIALWMLTPKENIVALKNINIPQKMNENWDELQILFDEENILNTISEAKSIKKKYQKKLF